MTEKKDKKLLLCKCPHCTHAFYQGKRPLLASCPFCEKEVEAWIVPNLSEKIDKDYEKVKVKVHGMKFNELKNLKYKFFHHLLQN